MMKRLGIFLLPASILLALGNVGCATSFQGRAQFPGGPGGCFAHCDRQNLRMAQFVYVGEYSSACVCELPERSASLTGEQRTGASSGAAVAAAAGVMTQMREQAR